MPKENKSTEAEYDSRVATIFDLMVKGITDRDMCQYVAKVEGWNVSKRQVDRYIAEANDLFAAEGAKHVEKEFGKAKIRLEMLFEKSLKIQDYKTCLAIAKEVSALFGLITTKADVNVKGDITVNINRASGKR